MYTKGTAHMKAAPIHKNGVMKNDTEKSKDQNYKQHITYRGGQYRYIDKQRYW